SFSKFETWFTSVCFSSLTSLFSSFRVSISDWRASFFSFIFSISSSSSSVTSLLPFRDFSSTFSFLIRQLPLQAGQFVLTVHLMIQHQIPPRRMHQEPVPSQN